MVGLSLSYCNICIEIGWTTVQCRPCPFIYILFGFYPDFISGFYADFILILSRFLKNSLYPDFILSFEKIRIKLEKIFYSNLIQILT